MGSTRFIKKGETSRIDELRKGNINKVRVEVYSNVTALNVVISILVSESYITIDNIIRNQSH